MKYYEIEIIEPSNSGQFSKRKIFTSLESANDYLNEQLEDCEYDEIENNEWTDTGPNWQRLKTIDTDWYIYCLDEIES